MPRVLVITDQTTSTPASVLLDEQVSAIHLDSEHSAWQFVERLGWAISDAEDSERARGDDRAQPPAQAEARTHRERPERVRAPRLVHARRGVAPLAS
jgi:hypothetical protein